jgi:hypothetical protein
VTVCPPAASDVACGQLRPKTEPPAEASPPIVLRDEHATDPTPMRVSAFIGTLSFNYGTAATPSAP